MSEYRLLQEKGRNEERREFIRLVKEQDREIDKLLGDSVKHVLRAVNKSTDRNGEINRRHFDKHIVFIFAFWATNFTNILVRSNRKATQIAGKEALSSIAIYNNKLYGEMIQASTGVLADRIERSLLTRRVFIDNVTLASRIKTIEKAYIRTVKDILTVGAKEGMSVRQMAFEIDNIIRPVGYKKWVSPFDWFRAARSGAVKGRRAGSVSYNSYRIARTEITETYRRSTVEIHSGKPWIAGFMWHLSSAHEVSCVCEDYDGVVFSGMDDLPITHPNCYCYVVPQLVDPSLVDK